MKTSAKIISLLVLVFFLASIQSCKKKKGEDPEPTEAEKTTVLLTKATWKLQTLTIDGVADDGFFKDLQVTFTDTGFTAVNGDPIWPASGNWTFTDANARKMKRGDGVEVIIDEITETGFTATIIWDKTTTGGRVESVPGRHVFKFGQ